MKKIGRMLAALLAAVLLCAAMGVLFAACGEGTEEPPQTDPVKVADGIDFDLAVGAEREFAVADYITANGNTVSALSEEEGTATAEVADGVLTIAAVSSGKTTVTLTCGEVTVTFGVTVYRTFTVSVDGEETQVRENGTFTLPAAPVPEDENMRFVAWQVGNEQKQPQDVITVTADVTVTAVYERKAPVKVKNGEAIEIAFGGSERRNVADYITTYGNTVSVSSEEAGTATAKVADGVLTIAALSSGKTTVTLTCGGVTVTFTVTVALPEVEAPVFENGSISFDLFETNSGSYAFGITAPAGVDFSYEYALVEEDANASFEENTLAYTATQPTQKTLTVNVTATATVSGETVEKTASFTVTVTVTDTTPAAKEVAVTEEEVVDLYLHVGGYVIDLAANISNAQHIVSYTVGGKPVSGTKYTLTGAYGAYTDTPQKVTLRIVGVVGGERDVEYTYTLSVIDSSAYRLYNGGFDLDLDGWTLDGTMDGEKNDAALGGISEETRYWENDSSGVVPLFYNDGKFFSAYAYTPGATERATGTLRSSNFIIGGSGWITYKLGGAKNIEQVYLEVVSADGAKRVKLPNFDWSDNAGSLVRGCTLVSYKANLLEYGFARGDKVYLRVTDNGNSTGDYGLFFLDSVVTYYPVGSEPDDSFNLVSKYRLYNGGFETGNLMGWELTGDIGVVTDDDNYWNDPNNVYNKNGKYLFSWYTNEDGVSREDATGTLQSRVFTLKQDAIVSFLLGGGQTGVSLEFVRPAADGAGEQVLARFTNQLFKNNGRLISYYYQFNLQKDTQCFVRVIDEAAVDEGPWRCFALDGVETYLAAAPDGYNLAVNQLSADV